MKKNHFVHSQNLGFIGGSAGKEPAWQCRRSKRGRLYPWVGNTFWRRKWAHALAVGYSLRGHKELDTTESVRAHIHTHLSKTEFGFFAYLVL